MFKIKPDKVKQTLLVFTVLIFITILLTDTNFFIQALLLLIICGLATIIYNN